MGKKIHDLPSASPDLTDEIEVSQAPHDAGTSKRVSLTSLQTLFQNEQSPRLLGTLLADFNSTGDQLIPLGTGFFVLTDIVVTNATVDMDTADDIQVWSEISRAGNKQFSSNTGIVAGLSSPEKYISYSHYYFVMNDNNTPSIVEDEVYFSLGTGQGTDAKANVYIYGYQL